MPELLAARDGFEVGHHEESYQQMIVRLLLLRLQTISQKASTASQDHFAEYTDVVGDHPLNIGNPHDHC